MKALGVAWEGASVETEVARMQTYCGDRGWELVARQLWATEAPELWSLMMKVAETGAARVLLTREVLTELEQGYPHLWAAIKERFRRRGISAVAV